MKSPGNKNIAYFSHFIDEIRPRKSETITDAEKKLREKINYLSDNKEALSEFQAQCRELLISSNIRELFSDTVGVFSSDNLFQQLFKDIKHKILPPLEDKDSINYKITQFFYQKDDFEWVTAIPNETWL